MTTDIIEVLTTQYVVEVSESPVQVVDTTISHIITEVSTTLEVVDTSVSTFEVLSVTPAELDVQIIEIPITYPSIDMAISDTEVVTEVFRISSEDYEMYTKRIDFVGDSVIYRGEALPGTAENATGWRIRQITISPSDGDMSETWASGNVSFDKVWSDHLIYSYT